LIRVKSSNPHQTEKVFKDAHIKSLYNIMLIVNTFDPLEIFKNHGLIK